MVNQNINVVINAQNNMSPVLKKIQGDMTQVISVTQNVTNNFNKAGAAGTQMGNNIQKGARSADTALRTLERTMLAAGAAAGGIALGVIKASAAYQSQERQINALNRMYGQGADEMLKYADMIQLTTRYSDDAARQSLILLNTLQQNFGISGNQIEALMSRATDLAQLHGKSLTEVTQMIQNALRGEAEYIEQLGVTLNQSFVAQEAYNRGLGNFISGMDQAEQAAFRYTLLMEQTANAQGAATEAMDGTRGTVSLMINQIGDLAQSAGGALGPIRDLAAEFNQYALWIPLIVSQTARMATVLTNSARSGELMAGAMGLLRAAISPIGLALTGIVLVGGAVINYFQKQKIAAAQAAQAAEETARVYDMLAESISRMYLAGNVDAANWARTQVDALGAFADEWQRVSGIVIEDMTASDSKWQGIPGLDLIDDVITGASDAVLNLVSFGNWGEARRQAREAKRLLIEDLKLEPEDEQEIGNAFQRVMSLADNPYVDQKQLASEWDSFLTGLIADVKSEEILPSEMGDEIIAFYNRFAEIAAEGAQKTQAAMEEFGQAITMRDLRLDGWTDSQISQIEIFNQLVDQIDTYKAALLSIPEPNTNIGEGIFNYQTGYSNLPDISHLQLTATEMELVAAAQVEINKAMMSGKYDNEALNSAMGMANRLFAEGKISGEQYAAVYVKIATGIDEFTLAAFDATVAGNELGTVVDNMARKAVEAATSWRLVGSILSETVLTMADAVDITQQVMGSSLVNGGFSGLEAGLAKALEMQEAIKEFIGDFQELAGLDDPLSQINLTSLRSEASGLAGEIANANSELETMFRIIVGNTDAMKSQADSILSWAEELINVRGELGRIDELVNKGLITGQSGVFDDGSQYAEAQNAYDSIAISTERIHDNLDAVQAIQAPIIAQSLEWQAQLTEDLLQQDAATQRLTLGWMDATSAQQAFQLVQQLTLLQSGELGDVSASTMDTIVQGAITANPLLFDMLESMGVISGTPVDFQINTEALTQGASELENLTTQISSLVDTLREIYDLPPLTINTGDAEGQISSVMQQINEWGGLDTEAEVKVTPVWQGGIENGDGTGGAMGMAPVEMPVEPVVDQSTLTALDPVELPVEPTVTDATIPDMEPVELPVTFTTDSSQITAAVSVWQGARLSGPTFDFVADFNALSGAVTSWSTAVLAGPTFNFVADFAALSGAVASWAGAVISGPTFKFVADVSAVSAAASAYNGQVVGTAYINIMPRMTGAMPGMRHGGMPSYAHGGRAMAQIWAAEGNNPEVAHYPNGNRAIMDQEGPYFVPPRTMITPSNMDRNPSRAGENMEVNVYVAGSVVTENDLKASLVSAIKQSVRQRDAAIGS